MDTTILELLNNCRSSNLDSGLKALDDLGYLIEKNTIVNADDNYNLIFYRKELTNHLLDEETKRCIEYFLFFMLLNYPDRASRTAWCLIKCCNKEFQEALCQAIELYFDKDDITVCYLVRAITNISEFEELTQRTLLLFQKIKINGLPHSSNEISNLLQLYKVHHNFTD